MATKKVPQRRNSKAGKSTGKSKSAKYFASNPEARAKKNKYNTEYHSSDERKSYRAKLNKKTRSKPLNGDKDYSHGKDGSIRPESRSKNRARNGKNKRSTKR
jgi:hypothetical protein